MRKTSVVILRVFALALGMTASLYADLFVEFSQTGSVYNVNGSASFAGGTAPLIGSAPVSLITVRDSSSAATVSQYTCTNCMLNFQTGPVLNYSVGNPYPWSFSGNFDAGGQIIVTGSVAGISTAGPLASGFWWAPVDFGQSAHVLHVDDYLNRSLFTLDSGLAQALGLVASGPGRLIYDLYNNGPTPSFPYSSQGAASVTLDVYPTPEPLSIVLFGTVLVGCAVLRYRHPKRR